MFPIKIQRQNVTPVGRKIDRGRIIQQFFWTHMTINKLNKINLQKMFSHIIQMNLTNKINCRKTSKIIIKHRPNSVFGTYQSTLSDSSNKELPLHSDKFQKKNMFK